MRMTRKLTFTGALLLMIAFVPSVFADELATRLNAVLAEGPAARFWQVKADDVAGWINEKRTDFVVVDVRPNPAEYGQGHIPGSIMMPVQTILSPQNLAQLPKDKKVVLACVTGQTQNLPVVALRALGYDAYTMSFGYSAWISGYHGGQLMKGAIDNAAARNFPVAR